MVVPGKNPLAVGHSEALRAQVAADGGQVRRREDQTMIKTKNSHCAARVSHSASRHRSDRHSPKLADATILSWIQFRGIGMGGYNLQFYVYWGTQGAHLRNGYGVLRLAFCRV
jgi:hypothetical protein